MNNYQCCSCGEVSSAEQINEITINECCSNRSERRQFVPIEKTNSYGKKWYRCPKCNTNIRRKGWIKQ